MKKYIKYIVIICLIIIMLAVIGFAVSNNKNNRNQNKSESGSFKIVTTFYPLYIMASNITQGANNIELVNMADVNVGCVHDYTLTTTDMKKLENANILIENGLGLESFIDKVTSSNKEIQIIDSSENIQNLIKEDDEINPHIWTSISNYILQVENIKKGLCDKNPENAEIYIKNAQEYIKKIEKLKNDYNSRLKKLEGKGAIILNESFEYLAKDLGINATAIHTSHEESSLSAENLKNIINTVKKDDIKIIIVDIDDDLKNAQTIANETGAQIYKLDSGLKGDMDINSYINSMNRNLETLDIEE